MSVSPDPVDFDDAIAFFRSLQIVSKDEWDALSQEAQQQAFTIAGVARVDVVRLVWEACEQALRQGTTLDDFKDAIGGVLANAWDGSVKDPGWRLETIFRTSVQRAYSAGRFREATQPDTLEDRPVWLFDAVMDGRTTPECKEANGTRLPADHPWWQENYPPRHMNCRSAVITLTNEQAHAHGGITRAPPIKSHEGFGVPISGWEPDPSNYPAALRPHLPSPVDPIPTPPVLPPAPSPAPPPATTPAPAPSAPSSAPPPPAKKPRAKKGAPTDPLPGADPDPDGLQIGVHIKKLTGPKKYVEHARRALASVWSEKIQAVLATTPIDELRLVKHVGKKTNGDWTGFGGRGGRTRLRLTCERAEWTFGKTFRPGAVWSISSSASTAEDAVNRTFTHELGHHIHLALPSFPRVDSIIRHAFASAPRPPITLYANKNRNEYWAECWAAYHYEPDALKAHDPGGYRMVEDVLASLGVLP